MAEYRFDLAGEDTDGGVARLAALSANALADDARLDEDDIELIIETDDGLEYAHIRAREIVRGATDGTDLYAEPEPIGEWVPDILEDERA